jgi:hypothetical protein
VWRPPKIKVCLSITTRPNTSMSSLSDLFEFLSSPNPAARHLALQNLVGHTPKNSPNRGIFVPSSFAGSGSNGGGLKPAGEGSSVDEQKVQALRDLCDLCRDQAVSLQMRRQERRAKTAGLVYRT